MQTGIEGKNCIVTGANSGIGYATAEGLASRCSSCFDCSLILDLLNFMYNSIYIKNSDVFGFSLNNV